MTDDQVVAIIAVHLAGPMIVPAGATASEKLPSVDVYVALARQLAVAAGLSPAPINNLGPLVSVNRGYILGEKP
jgi:hypothetical protein